MKEERITIRVTPEDKKEIELLAEKYKITQEFAENYLELSGAKIYSTQNSTIQSAIEQEFEKEKLMYNEKI